MNITEYFEPGLSSIEEVIDRYGKPLDATTLQKLGDCPRKYQVRVEENLTKPSTSLPMVAGIALHAGLEYYYAFAIRDAEVESEAIRIMQAEWDSFNIDRTHIDMKYGHLTSEHLTEIMEAYFHHWNFERIEIYQPVAGLHISDLDLSRVIAAKFLTTDDGRVILGESSLIMRFDVAGEELIWSGKPDLPVRNQSGALMVMDHKTTSSYLSDWWAQSYEVSNKMRAYMAMVESLLGETPQAAIINGIFVGKNATNPKSTATKFQRFEYDFTPDHITEALQNWLTLKKTADFYRELGYWPQTCAFGGCGMPDLCRRDPLTRAEVKATDYVEDTREFWNL